MGSSKKQTVGYRYFMGLHFGLCHGPVDALLEIRGGDRTAWSGQQTTSGRISINAPELFGGEKKEGGIVGELDVMMGEADQAPNDYLISQLGTPMPAFRGMLSAVFRKGMVGAMNPYPKAWAFKVRRILKGWHGGSAWYPEKATVPLTGYTPPFTIQWRKTASAPYIFTNPSQVPGWSMDPADYPDVVDTGTSISWPGGVTGATGIAWLHISAPNGVPEPFTLDVKTNYDDSGKVLGAHNVTLGPGTPPNPVDTYPRQEGVSVIIPRHSGPFEGWVAYACVDGRDIETGLPLGGPTAHRMLNSATAIMATRHGMNPAHIIYQGLTDPDWGMGYPPATIDAASFMAAADTFHAEGLGLCGLWTQQDSIENFLQDVANHAGAVIVQDRRTGLFKLLPVRGGYDVGSLPEFRRGLNVRAVEDFQRAGLGETVNEVVVQYNDAVAGQRGSVTVQHLANIQAQGGVVSQTLSFPLIPSPELAQRVAMRELLARATPLCKAKLRVDRSGAGILPGDVIRWSDAKLGIVDMPMRVLNVAEGSATDGTVQLDVAEDVFGLPATTYVGQQPSGWEEPNREPQAPAAAVALELPYVAIHRAEGATAANALAPESGFLGMAAAKPPGVSYGFTLYTRPAGGDWEETGTGEWTATAILSAEAGPGDATLQVAAVSDPDAFAPGALVMIGSGRDAELVRVDGLTSGTLTVGRGVADTVPNAAGWPVGTRLWVLEDDLGTSAVEWVQGEVVEAAAATNAGGGTLPVASAPQSTVGMDARAARPYPPAALTVNAEAWPVELFGELTLEWAHRDRLLQADQLIDQAAGSIGPEAGTTYTVRTYLDDVLHDEQTGITGDTATVEPTLDGLARVEVVAVRDGLESWQAQVRQFQYRRSPYQPYVDQDGEPYVDQDGEPYQG